ncbi:MAG TPA: TIGR00730 family Rossman fold protein [Verrucomicrobiota bacterium]|nr:TIGR00730 family Rossman fold protein [Verrucomicrobiota bacterium]
MSLENENQIKKMVSELIFTAGGGHNPDIVEDIIINALKILRDVENRGDARVIQTSIRELRYAFRLFAPYENIRKITVFGSARTEPSRLIYKQAVEFGRLAKNAGFMIITGAGPGIMQAALEGAGKEMSFGVNIRLPWEQTPNPVIQNDNKLVTFKYFFTRKLTFIRNADAVVLFPGGFGTMDEGYEALTLMQTGKSRPMPLILLDEPGGTFWKTWDKNTKEHLLRDRYISEEDLNLYQITDNPDIAVKWISRFYRNFHSLRFVKDLLVIRLQHFPSVHSIEALNDDFSDIIADGKINIISPTEEEKEDDDFLSLPRIAFKFTRKNYGRLRQLIDRLNTL